MEFTVTITVAEGNTQDVNAHYIDAGVPPALAPSPPPLAPGATHAPTHAPSAAPTAAPTAGPAPTSAPTSSPAPTSAPSAAPSAAPTAAPAPPTRWRYTGTWDASDSYTHGWGPVWGKVERPASTHPTTYSITGSNNTHETGKLSIISSTTRGWIHVSFSGARVLEISVTNVLGESLPGAWDYDEQEWIPDDREPTVHATWTVAVT